MKNLAICWNELEDTMIPQCENSLRQSISREVDYAWLAGIIDGEGNICVSIKEISGKSYFMPKIRIANTDIRMIHKIAEIYTSDNLVFFYTINKRKRYNNKWKDQLHIEIASQGTAKKLLEKVIPYLTNKKVLAKIVLDMIEYVQNQKKSGRLTPKEQIIDYVKSAGFIALMDQYNMEKKFYIDPSTTKRRASDMFTW